MPSPSSAFTAAVARILETEGGFSTDRQDNGNWTGGKAGVGEFKGTKFGIAASSYPSVDIANLTVEEARAIYYRDYWQPIRGDELPGPVAFVLFDAAVNQGVKTAIRFLQAALQLEVDGVIGPKTLTAAHMDRDPIYLASRVLRRRIEAYSTLDGWTRYRASWVQRCFDIFRAAIEVHA